MARRFKHLTKSDRIRIEQQLRDGKEPKEIAESIGVHISTVYREKKRGEYQHRNSDYTEETRYSSDLAEMKYRAHLAAKGADLKIGKDQKLADYIEHKIADEKYSPEAVLGEIKAQGIEFDTEIKSKNTIYSYIEKGVFLRLTNKDLPVKGNKKRQYHKVKEQKRASKGDSIEKRPEEIDERSTFGHWEMDTVVSARPGKAAILVLTERLTRDEITAKLPDKTAASVVQALDDLEREWGEKFPQVFRTITVDNGSEFSDCPGIERSALGEGSRTKCYYCHPYSSYERGSNENVNKMIRRWLPKGTNFDELTDEVLEAITTWINNYPRKILGFLTSGQVFQQHITALLGAS
ncbi:MAG: IS30 family transposase [Lachnospiraceae bacterium]|nr:IS30 family transposase [Lachnospiraceae bacterium]